MDDKLLVQKAFEARENAYAPYSHFRVGAALLTRDSRVYTGCNVESCAYSPSCCAERVAIYKAVSDGCKAFSAIAVIAENTGYCFPCGVCLQVLSEFVDASTFRILVAKTPDDYGVYTLDKLLPYGFRLNNT